jgi:UDP-N-acetyl-D-glucosamine dehydrogenase
MSAGREIFLAYSPERIDPGNQTWNLRNTPKIVAGLTKDCLDLAIAFYGAFVDQLVPVSNIRTAETAKLFENTFRMVNIGLVNEFQVICDAFGIDVWEALGACKTKPYGFMSFQPGPGLGGHCIPVDPFYLAWKARERHVSTEFIDLAGRVNDSMPAYVVGLVTRLLSEQQRAVNGSRVALSVRRPPFASSSSCSRRGRA